MSVVHDIANVEGGVRLPLPAHGVRFQRTRFVEF